MCLTTITHHLFCFHSTSHTHPCDVHLAGANSLTGAEQDFPSTSSYVRTLNASYAEGVFPPAFFPPPPPGDSATLATTPPAAPASQSQPWSPPQPQQQLPPYAGGGTDNTNNGIDTSTDNGSSSGSGSGSNTTTTPAATIAQRLARLFSLRRHPRPPACRPVLLQQSTYSSCAQCLARWAALGVAPRQALTVLLAAHGRPTARGLTDEGASVAGSFAAIQRAADEGAERLLSGGGGGGRGGGGRAGGGWSAAPTTRGGLRGGGGAAMAMARGRYDGDDGEEEEEEEEEDLGAFRGRSMSRMADMYGSGRVGERIETEGMEDMKISDVSG